MLKNRLLWNCKNLYIGLLATCKWGRCAKRWRGAAYQTLRFERKTLEKLIDPIGAEVSLGSGTTTYPLHFITVKGFAVVEKWLLHNHSMFV
jgi:hypothetical protein